MVPNRWHVDSSHPDGIKFFFNGSFGPQYGFDMTGEWSEVLCIYQEDISDYKLIEDRLEIYGLFYRELVKRGLMIDNLSLIVKDSDPTKIFNIFSTEGFYYTGVSQWEHIKISDDMNTITLHSSPSKQFDNIILTLYKKGLWATSISKEEELTTEQYLEEHLKILNCMKNAKD